MHNNFYKSSTVSLAITSSSLVGMIRTLTFEDLAEISRIEPSFLALLAFALNLTPKNSSPLHTSSLTVGVFSPIPAVKTMQLSQPITAAYAPTNFLT